MLAYDEFRVLLREELGTAPGPELVALYEQLLAPRRPGPERSADLLERDDELTAIAAAPARWTRARAACSPSKAPPGSARRGCSASCASSRGEAGAEILDARAGVLEREFGFGVVRQLFEGTDPPAAAGAVFGEGGPGDGLFAVLSALHTHAGALAARRPLVLCVDDLQWSDTASLRSSPT